MACQVDYCLLGALSHDPWTQSTCHWHSGCFQFVSLSGDSLWEKPSLLPREILIKSPFHPPPRKVFIKSWLRRRGGLQLKELGWQLWTFQHLRFLALLWLFMLLMFKSGRADWVWRGIFFPWCLSIYYSPGFSNATPTHPVWLFSGMV